MAERSIGYYLAEAKLALAYTKSVIPAGPMNQLNLKGAANTLTHFGANLWGGLFAKAGGDIAKGVEGLFGKKVTGERADERGVEIMSQFAHKFHGGNCQEHAAVASIFLRDRGTSPVEFMGLYDMNFKPKHAFVVLGREDRSSPKDTHPSTWKGPVVICDPWDDDVYLAQDHDPACWPGRCSVTCRW